MNLTLCPIRGEEIISLMPRLSSLLAILGIYGVVATAVSWRAK